MIVEKRGYPIGDADPSDSAVINEMATDSWPKMIPSETEFVGTDGDEHIYHGPVDERWYDSDDMDMIRESDTTTVVCE